MTDLAAPAQPSALAERSRWRTAAGERRVVRLPVARVSVRVEPRTIVVSSALALLVVVGVGVALCVGDYPIPFLDVVRALGGHGNVDNTFTVNNLRLPRALTGVLVGGAFGFSGSIFQSLARNPLASPDVIGITGGAGAVAVALIVLAGAGTTVVTFGALAGGLLTAALIYGLAYRKGVLGYRLVLIGIGMAAMTTAITQYLLTRAQIYEAQRAMVWLTGSLSGRGWENVWPLALALALFVPPTLGLGRSMRLLELGDDTARGLGVRVEPARAGLIACAVVLVSVATASAGPVAFLALVAPQIARRLVRSPGATLVPSALTGAALLVWSDMIAQRIFSPTELPVGVVTGVIGAPYLLYLLARANRLGTGE